MSDTAAIENAGFSSRRSADADDIDPLAEFDASFSDCVPEEKDLNVHTIKAAPAPDGFDAGIPEGNAIVADDDLIDDYDDEYYGDLNPIEDQNRYFRPLGYLSNTNYFLSLQSGQIFPISPSNMRASYFMQLAPKEWWLHHFPAPVSARSPLGAVSWEDATNAMIKATYAKGTWNPASQVGQGARMDQGRVVFNTGDALYVSGEGRVKLSEFSGEYQYTSAHGFKMPDTDTPFQEGDAGPRELLDIIGRLNWRSDRRNLSVMAFFGWIAISPICGILKWRPHLWLDGQRSSGKSWVIENIVGRALGDYVIQVKSNSTESGLRNLLHARSLPLVFDEAEGEDGKDRVRMDDIIKLARHSATEGKFTVAQGVSGGGGQRHFSIASMFMLSSITPQISASADVTRFARCHLGPSRKGSAFTQNIEIPAENLLTQDFADRMIGRMLVRAPDYKAVFSRMIEALTLDGMERRLADVYGTFATGAYLLLRDGIPETVADAQSFILDEFDSIKDMNDFGEEISDDKDHDRLFRVIRTHEITFDSRNMGRTSMMIGSLIQVASGLDVDDEGDDIIMSPKEAAKLLMGFGIRTGIDDKTCPEEDMPNTILIHKNSPKIAKMLENTAYRSAYADVMMQAEGVKSGPVTRFGVLGSNRPAVVPIKYFTE